MRNRETPNRDLRKYLSQTYLYLIFGGILLLFIVGDGLVLLIWGPTAAISGLLCLGAGLLPIILIIVVLWIMQSIVAAENKRNR